MVGINIWTRFVHLWQRLTEPAAAITDPVERARARLLASVLWVSIIGVGVVLPLRYLLDPVILNAVNRASACWLSAAVLLGCLMIIRRGHVRAGMWLAVIISTSVILLLVWLARTPIGAASSLSYLFIVLMFCTHFMSIRAALAVFTTHLLLIVTVAPLLSNPYLSQDNALVSTLATYAAMSFIALAYTHHRNGIERAQRLRIQEAEQGSRLAEQKRLEDEFQQERLKLIGTLVQSVSHDFRTRLATILTSSYLAQRYVERGDALQAQGRLRLIAEGVQMMTTQLENLQAVGSVVREEHEVCDLNRLLDSLVRQQAQVAGRQSLTLDFDPLPDLPPVAGSSDGLSHVFELLIQNALAYTPPRGCVTVRTRRESAAVVVEVEDTGIGIEAEHLQRIFDPFYKVDEARNTDNSGVGVGLSIAKLIVEAHGGQVTVASEPGMGSVFSVRLPAAAA